MIQHHSLCFAIGTDMLEKYLQGTTSLLCVTYGRQTPAKSDLRTARVSADQLHRRKKAANFTEAGKRQQNALGIDRHFLG
jgi:hypothetical protein